MKHKNIPLILLILFSAVTYNLYAQQKYWNEHTQLTPWRFPLTADKAGLTYEDLTGDDTPDIIRAFVLDSIPVMWIDDDGDMRYDDLEGDTDNGSVLAGQIAGMITKRQSCQEIVDEVMDQAERLLKIK